MCVGGMSGMEGGVMTWMRKDNDLIMISLLRIERRECRKLFSIEMREGMNHLKASYTFFYRQTAYIYIYCASKHTSMWPIGGFHSQLRAAFRYIYKKTHQSCIQGHTIETPFQMRSRYFPACACLTRFSAFVVQSGAPPSSFFLTRVPN